MTNMAKQMWGIRILNIRRETQESVMCVVELKRIKNPCEAFQAATRDRFSIFSIAINRHNTAITLKTSGRDEFK